MTLLAPFALLLLALIPPIIALYLLKLRRQEQVVSSTYLWQRFVQDVEANAPWQKLRRNLLLLLQILFMLILIAALTRPATEAEGVAGRSLVLILDTSASMGATDGDPTRLDSAKAAARDLVTNLPDDARVTVIAAAGGEAGLLVSASQDRRQALNAIETAQATALGSDLSPALTLAEAIVAREPAAEIALLSDGAIQHPERLTAPVRLIPAGQAAANQAISALSVERDGRLFVQISNYGDQPAQRRLVIELDGRPFTALDLDLPAGQHVEQVIEGLPAGAQTVTAALSAAETDRLPLDDRAWAVLRPAGPVQTTLVTDGNFFLQTALSLLGARPGAGLDLTVMNVGDWEAGRLDSQNHPPNLPTSHPSLHIFDIITPTNLPPGNLLFIGPTAPAPGLFEVLGQATTPIPQPVQGDHPLLRNVSLADTQILTMSVISAGSWSRAVVNAATPEGETIPLLLAGEIEGRRVVVLPFALQQSDLPLRPAFPLLMANLVDYLAPGAAGLVPPELTPGEAVTLSTPPEVDRLRLTGPGGSETTVAVEAGRATLPPLTAPGLYRLRFEQSGLGGGALDEVQFAVNFFNRAESTITPQPELTLDVTGRGEIRAASLPPAYREWWRPLALAALALLVVEWLVYQRGKVMRYWEVVTRRT